MSVVGIAVVLALVVARVVTRRRRRGTKQAAPLNLGPVGGDVAMIAAREIRERARGRVLRVGTLVILAVVAAAIVIPTLTTSTNAPERVGVVGPLTSLQQGVVHATATSVGARVDLRAEASLSMARAALRSGRLDAVLVDGRALVLDTALSPSDDSTGALFVDSLAKELGVVNAMASEGLSASQVVGIERARSIPVTSLSKGAPTKSGAAHPTSIVGLVLTFIMLSQYLTWVLIGVMEEKSSRVVEVLLAAVRPIRLLFGKIIGIGAVALGQATIIVVFALLVAHAVGSTILQGAAPLTIVAQLFWLVLGYGFYCWVYAAAGATVERQNQVQSLAFPLSLPILFGYVASITAVSSGSASLLVKVLAYLPPTAPFAMPVLVSLRDVAWWEFTGSALLSIVSTVLLARFAATVYRRAILQTGGRVRLRTLLSAGA